MTLIFHPGLRIPRVICRVSQAIVSSLRAHRKRQPLGKGWWNASSWIHKQAYYFFFFYLTLIIDAPLIDSVIKYGWSLDSSHEPSMSFLWGCVMFCEHVILRPFVIKDLCQTIHLPPSLPPTSPPPFSFFLILPFPPIIPVLFRVVSPFTSYSWSFEMKP